MKTASRALYNFIFQTKQMRFKAVEMPEVLDHEALLEIHANIIQNIEEMDRLSSQFKVKQEEHFLRTFMNILERMGNDLILAQEAYRNIDIEIKRDKYFTELANELNFFKNQCLVLKKENTDLKKQIRALKIDDEAVKNEIKSLKMAYEKKTIEIKHLKDITGTMKLKLRDATLREKDNLVSPQKLKQFAEAHLLTPHEQMVEKNTQFAERWILTQQQSRKKGQSVDLGENATYIERGQQKGNRYTPTPGMKFRSTHASTFRKGSQERARSRMADETQKVEF